MSTKDIYSFRLDVHYKNHHTNGQLTMYGNELLSIVPPKEGGIDITYEVTPTEIIFLGQEKEPCVANGQSNNSIDIDKCLDKYIDSHLNCTLPWQAMDGTGDHQAFCQYPDEYDQYVQLLYDEVYNFDIQSISSIANCIPSCIRHEYFLKHKETRQKTWENSSTIQFYFGKYLFTVKKQYYTYNFQDFLADFGGYLGLLLGYSILGFYDTLTDIVNIAYAKRWGRKCVSV